MTRNGKRAVAGQPDQLLLYYPDGSYKTLADNPLGSARAGAGVVKCCVKTDDTGKTTMHHLYNISLPVVTNKSMKKFQNLNIGANTHSNIVAEWTALAYAIMDILWTVEAQPNEIFDIELRQDCYEVLDVIVNAKSYNTNVPLIDKVKELWK